MLKTLILYKREEEMDLKINKDDALYFDINAHKVLNNSMTPALFHQLVNEKNTRIIRSMIRRKVDLNQPGAYGYTPLMVASLTGNIEGVQLLVNAGADVNVSLKTGQTALWLASLNGHSDIVSFLAKKGANVNVVDKEKNQTPLMLASDLGYFDTVKALLKAKADVNFVSPHGQTALSYALIGIAKSMDIVKKLVQAGADIHSAPQTSENKIYTLPPLVLAVLHHNEAGAKFLLSKGANGIEMALSFAKSRSSGNFITLIQKHVAERKKKILLTLNERERN